MQEPRLEKGVLVERNIANLGKTGTQAAQRPKKNSRKASPPVSSM
jgi:hypothetical protein